MKLARLGGLATLFIESEPDCVLRTNVAGFVYGDRDY